MISPFYIYLVEVRHSSRVSDLNAMRIHAEKPIGLFIEKINLI